MLRFDSLGYLIPYDIIPLSEDTFYKQFILNGNLPNIRQKNWVLFNQWVSLIQKYCKDDFQIWIWGSMASLNDYKESSDIDATLLLPLTIYNYLDKAGIIEWEILQESKTKYNVDAHCGWIPESNSKNFVLDWCTLNNNKRLWYCTSMDKHPKGCIRLDYQ